MFIYSTKTKIWYSYKNCISIDARQLPNPNGGDLFRLIGKCFSYLDVFLFPTLLADIKRPN